MSGFWVFQDAVAILAPRALILTPWTPTVVLQRLVQVSERSICKCYYKVAILAPRARILKPCAPNGGFTKAFSGF